MSQVATSLHVKRTSAPGLSYFAARLLSQGIDDSLNQQIACV